MTASSDHRKISASSPHRSAILVIRVWTDHDPGHPLRGRVLKAVEGGVHLVATTISVAEIMTAVRDWPEEFQAGESRPPQ